MGYKASIGILAFCNRLRLSAYLSDAVHHDLGLNRCILLSYILAVLVAVPPPPFLYFLVPFLFIPLPSPLYSSIAIETQVVYPACDSSNKWFVLHRHTF